MKFLPTEVRIYEVFYDYFKLLDHLYLATTILVLSSILV